MASGQRLQACWTRLVESVVVLTVGSAVGLAVAAAIVAGRRDPIDSLAGGAAQLRMGRRAGCASEAGHPGAWGGCRRRWRLARIGPGVVELEDDAVGDGRPHPCLEAPKVDRDDGAGPRQFHTARRHHGRRFSRAGSVEGVVEGNTRRKGLRGDGQHRGGGERRRNVEAWLLDDLCGGLGASAVAMCKAMCN